MNEPQRFPQKVPEPGPKVIRLILELSPGVWWALIVLLLFMVWVSRQ